ncbi:MAG: hypothetical protein FJ248_00590 [Nitrospira sp.]|nr:hypothetical protein [Nitrospira sp.]
MSIRYRSLAFVVLAGSLYAATIGLAGELATKEPEEVADEEKIKWAQAAKISLIEAIRTATMHTPGQVIEAGLHAIHGRLLYEVEVVSKDNRVVELLVDPQTGKLIQQGELKK